MRTVTSSVMLTAGPGSIRVGLDAHAVGRQQTGNERFTVELATALARRDDVDVVCFLDRDAVWPADIQAAPRFVRLRARRPQLRIPFELPLRARRSVVDLLQVAYVAPPILEVPLVTVVHDLSFEDQPQMFSVPTRLRLKASVRHAVRKSAAVVTGSEFTRRRLIDIYGLPEAIVHHVRYGVGAYWRPIDTAEADAILAPYSLPDRFVLAVGTSDPRKNLERLVRAVAAIRSSGDADLALVLSGPDRRSGSLDDAIAAAGGTDWVKRLGYVDDAVLRALYAVADVFAYPSLYEGFGLPVLEALACGAVVVASGTTAVAEAAGDACVIVDPSDEESIRDGLRTALHDDGRRAEIRTRAQAHLAAFSWDGCATQMMDVYRSVVRPAG